MQRFAPYVLTFLAILLLFFSIAGPRGYLHLREIRNETMRLKEKNRRLEQEIAGVSSDIGAIQHSDLELETKAREELGLSRRNEIVYIFSEKAKRGK